MTIGAIMILAIQLLGAIALGNWIGDWIVYRGERKAVKAIKEGSIYEDSSGGRWEVVDVSKHRHCIAYRLHSHLYEGEWHPATVGTVMISGADIFSDHKRIK